MTTAQQFAAAVGQLKIDGFCWWNNADACARHLGGEWYCHAVYMDGTSDGFWRFPDSSKFFWRDR